MLLNKRIQIIFFWTKFKKLKNKLFNCVNY